MKHSGTKMEIEIKLKVASEQEGLDRIALLPAELEEAPRFEDNEIYDTAAGYLTANQILLRLRVVMGHGTLTLKEKVPGSSSQRAKVLKETETSVESPDAIRAIFAAVGLKRVYRYQKYRSYHAWMDPSTGRSLMISLDNTPIGVFLELEGDQESIDRAANTMGFAPGDYIITDYRSLHKEFVEKRGEPFGDMVFGDNAETGRQGG